MLPDIPIVLIKVPHAGGRERLVSLLHLMHGPPQRVRGQLRLHHHRRQQVRDVLIHAQLEAFRVDHDEPNILRRGPIQDAGQHRIHANALAGSRRPRNQ